MCCSFFFFLMIRRPPRSTLDRSSAASDVYKRQEQKHCKSCNYLRHNWSNNRKIKISFGYHYYKYWGDRNQKWTNCHSIIAVSYTHLRAHETVLDIVCRLLLEKKKKQNQQKKNIPHHQQLLQQLNKKPITSHNTLTTLYHMHDALLTSTINTLHT